MPSAKKTSTRKTAPKKPAAKKTITRKAPVKKSAPKKARSASAKKQPTLKIHDTHNGKSRVATALLALFVGGLGIHRFYMGQIGLGLIYLLFSWTLIPGLIAFCECIYLLCISDEQFAEICT